MPSELLISASGVCKRFTRNLRKSMWYGAADLLKATIGQSRVATVLRPDEFWALNEVSFELRRGECLGVLGKNGAGKSTLLKLLSGILRPDRGEIRVCGKLGALIEIGAGFHPQLTGRENIFVNGAILGMTNSEIRQAFDSIVDFAEIEEFLDMPVRAYSSGMYVRLGFAIAVHRQPDVLLVDEVLAVGDLGFRAKCYNALANLLANSAVVIVTHNLTHMARVATRAMVLERGRPRFLGSVADGIKLYEKSVPTAAAVEVRSGRGEIRELKIYSQTGAVQEFAFGDKLVISLVSQVAPEIESFHVVLQFFDRAGEIAGEINSLTCGRPFENTGLPLSIKFSVKQLCLAPGCYSLSAMLFGGARQFEHLHLKERAAEIVVTGVVPCTAAYLLDAQVEVERL